MHRTYSVCVRERALLLHMLNNATAYTYLHLMILIFNANALNCGCVHIYLQTFSAACMPCSFREIRWLNVISIEKNRAKLFSIRLHLAILYEFARFFFARLFGLFVCFVLKMKYKHVRGQTAVGWCYLLIKCSIF